MTKEDNVITYMDYLWVQVADNMLTIGLNDEGVTDIDRIRKIDLPPENEELAGDGVCGEVETDDGSIDLYCPVKAVVTEINEAVRENPTLILEDPYGEGWLFRVQAEDTEELNEFVENQGRGTDDDDDDDDDDDKDEDDEDYEED